MEFGLPAPFPGVPSIVGDILSRQSSPYISPQVLTFSLGQAYDESMCEYINKYLELDTNDRLCYVGIDQGTLVPVLRRCFVLTEPVTEVNPSQGCVGVVDRHGTREELMNKVSVEEFFRQEATKHAQFTKVLLKDAMGYISNWPVTFKHILKTMTTSGKLLVVHRPGQLNSLPVSLATKHDLRDLDPRPVDTLITDMKRCGEEIDVHWNMEQLLCTVPTQHWMTMINNRYPPPLEASSTVDARRIQSGLLELAKGIFRYSGEDVEFTDRLVFLTAERRLAQVVLHSPYYQTPASSPVWRCVRSPPSKPEVVLVNVYTDELDSCVREKIKQEQSRKRPMDNR